MQRFLTAAAVVSTMALATSGLALAQGATTSPSGTINPSTAAHATTTPGTPSAGMTNPSSSTNGESAQNQPGDTGSSHDIRQAQEQLKQQGLYKGRVDGKMGPETAQAISKFQEKNGLPQSSQLDQQTMAKLGGGNGMDNNTGMSTNGSGSSVPPASMHPSTSNPGAGSSMGSGGASTPSGTTNMPNAGGTTTH